MARPLLPLTALLLLAALLAPAAQAAPPRVGYGYTGDPDDQAFSLAQGAAHTYNFTVALAPATGSTTVDLEVAYSDFRSVYPDALAPPAIVLIRKADADGYTELGLVSGFRSVAGFHNQTLAGLSSGEYLVQVTATLDEATPFGEHPSHLGFTVRDPGVRTSTATASYPFTFDVLPPANQAPLAVFSHIVSGLSVSVDASASSDPDDLTLGYLWEFGDDTISTLKTATHTYAQPGTYTITLRVTDPDDLYSEDSATVTVVASGGGSTGGNNGGNNGGGSGVAPGADPDVPLDTDGDTFPDELETASGSDPKNRLSVPADRDGDGKLNEADNCPAASNADQADKDGDRLGDVCDANDDDGPTGDPDGDGKPSSTDNCPGKANADQLDLDTDGKGDACDTDRDGDGVVNEADAFPLDPKESLDSDGDGLGNNADADDDNDLLKDADEAAAGSDPLDRHDPPWLATAAVAVRLNGTNLVRWEAPADPRVQRFLVWREASPYSLLATVPALGGERFEFLDDAPPARARYHIQAQLDGTAALSYLADDDRTTNWVTAQGAVAEECGSLARDGDGDGLCDTLERQMGLDPAKADGDGDGLKDGDELLGTNGRASLPTVADSDGDGRNDGEERRQGTDPLRFDTAAATVEPKEGQGLPGWLWPTLILAGAIVVAALILRGRRPAP